MVGEDVDLVDVQQPMDAMAPYERLLGDALEGDHTLFGSFDGIAAAWRIVDGILDKDSQPHLYRFRQPRTSRGCERVPQC